MPTLTLTSAATRTYGGTQYDALWLFGSNTDPLAWSGLRAGSGNLLSGLIRSTSLTYADMGPGTQWDGADYYSVDRGLMSFDTSSIPVGAVVTSAALRFKVRSPAGLTNSGTVVVEPIAYTQGQYQEMADDNASTIATYYSYLNGSIFGQIATVGNSTFTDLPDDSYANMDFTISPSAITVGGLTQLGFFLQTDHDDTTPGVDDRILMFFGTGGPAGGSQFVIEYVTGSFSFDTENLTGLDNTYEYSINGGTTYTTCDADGTTSLSAVINSITATNDITYRLIASPGTVYTIDITAGPSAPSTTFTMSSGASAYKLVGSTSLMQYSLSGGTSWTTASTDTNLSAYVSVIDPLYGILIRTSATGTTLYGSSQTHSVTKPSAPRGLVFSREGSNACLLMGSTTAMEYSLDGGSNWSVITGSNMNMCVLGLSNVTAILVRYAASGSMLPGYSASLGVNQSPSTKLTTPQLVDMIRYFHPDVVGNQNE